MRQKMKRVISALLAGVLTFTGLVSSFPSYAEEGTWYETLPEAQESGEDENGQAGFNLTLLFNESVSFTYEDERFDHQDEDTEDIVLTYGADEKAEITIKTAEGTRLLKLRVVDKEKKDYEFTYEESEGKLSFMMPAEDVWLYTETEKIPSEEPEDGSTAEEPAAAEEAGEEPLEELPAEEPDAGSYEESVSDSAAEDPETGGGMNAETDGDGLPSQGSVVTVDPVSIPFDTWEFDVETDFTNIDYDPSLFTVSYVSDDIVYDVPGTYSSVYHVTDNESGKFWFVLRPVIVAEEPAEPETEIQKEEETEVSESEEEFSEADTEKDTEETSEDSFSFDNLTIRIVNEDLPVSAEGFLATDAVISAEAENTGTQNAEGMSVEIKITVPDGIILPESLAVSANKVKDQNKTMWFELTQTSGSSNSAELTDAFIDGNEITVDIRVTGKNKETEDPFDGWQLALSGAAFLVEEAVGEDLTSEEIAELSDADPLEAELAFYNEYIEPALEEENEEKDGEEGNDTTPAAVLDDIGIVMSAEVIKEGYEPSVLSAEAAITVGQTEESDNGVAPLVRGTLYGESRGRTNHLSDVIDGLSRQSVLEWLSDKTETGKNSGYYLGTPYSGSDHRQPNGDTGSDASRGYYGADDTPGTPMLVCTGFVWHVLWRSSSLNYSQAWNRIPCRDTSISWPDYINNDSKGQTIEYKSYLTSDTSQSGAQDLIDYILDDGYIEPGDLLYICGQLDSSAFTNGFPEETSGSTHIGIYIGGWNGYSKNTWWDSTNVDYITGESIYSNVIGKITPKAAAIRAVVIKIGDENSGLALKKSSANTSVTNSNSAYSLAGAEYTVKDSSGKTVGTLTTKSDGSSNTLELPLGTYTVTEKTAPAGYKKDQNTYTVVLTSDYTSDSPYQLTVSDEPLAYPTASLTLEKTTPYATTKSLADARFEVKFYAGATGASGSPARTWVLKSDEDSNVKFDKRHLVSGDDFYTDSSGDIVLPLGYYTIEEILPPEGYQLSDDIVTYTVTDSNGSAKLVTDGSTVVKQEPVISDEPIWGGIEIEKRDIETEDGQPQGDATLEGAVYSIINMNDYDVALKTDENTGYGPGEEVLRITTDENGHAESGIILQYGSYKVVEVTPPTGYTPEGENTVFEFTIENNDEVFEYTVKNRVIRFDIQLIKFRDTLSSEEAGDDVEPIEGVTFGIYLKRTDELILTITTDEEGVATTADPENYPYGRLPYGTYVIRELEYPEDVVPVEDFEVFGEIDGKTYAGIYKNDKPVESGITVVKTDAETGRTIPLAGTEFQILDESGEVLSFSSYYPHYEEITNFVTDDSGSITLPEKLPYGSYYLHEVNAPYGYLRSEDIAFEITEFNYWPETVTVELPDVPEKGQIVIGKYDAQTKESLSGAVFAVFADEDIVTPDGTVRAVKDQFMEAVTIDETGTGMSGELYLGTYYVQEIKAPAGYCLDDTRMRVTLSYEDQETPVTYAYPDFYDAPTTVRIRKVNEEDEALAGVKFEITPVLLQEENEDGGTDPQKDKTDDSEDTENETEAADDAAGQAEDAAENEDGTVYEPEEAVTDEDGMIIERYLAPGIYRITETQTLEHYILDDTARYVTVDANGFIFESDEAGIPLNEDRAKSDTATLTWVNATSSVPVDVSKKEIAGSEELPGAKLTVTDEDGVLIDEWISGTEPHRMNLFAGTYTLTEVAAPEGYASAESVEFTIDNENVVHTVTMYDAPTVLYVSKKDITGSEELIGAHLAIRDEAGNTLYEWTSAEEPYVIEGIPAGDYQLIETIAPEGYAKTEAVSFTVTDTDKVQQVTMYDSPTQVEISKKDLTDDGELPGAHLTVKDADGNTLEEWTSKKTPHTVTGLFCGTYTLTEVTAPEGYDVAESVEFTVTDTEEVQQVTMYDSPKEGTVDLTGLTSSGTPGSSGSAGNSVTAGSVKTGDYFRYGAAVLLIAAGAVLFIYSRKKKKLS